MIRVLQVVPDMGAGGIENYIMNMYRSILQYDIQFDFLVHHEREAFFDSEIEALGGRIYRLPVLDDKRILRYKNEVNRLLASKEWNIVHGHIASLASFYLKEAEDVGIPCRIVHSHGSSFLKTPKGYAKYLLFKRAKKHANVKLACSTEAGQYLFGNEVFYLAKNAIDAGRFEFNAAKRAKVRNQFGWSDQNLVIGHIGRFNLQKNHSFLEDVFSQLIKNRPDARLLLVGAGETRENVKHQVDRLGLSSKVIFKEVTDDPGSYYSAMDVFVMPSLFEGLPLAGIEAQCSGLPCYFSQEITREVAISENAFFLNLADGDISWASAIETAPYGAKRQGMSRLASRHGFDCDANTEKMAKLYQCLNEGGLGSVGSILD